MARAAHVSEARLDLAAVKHLWRRAREHQYLWRAEAAAAQGGAALLLCACMSETVREEERRGAAHANGPCERVEPTQQEPPAGELVAVVVQLRVVHAAHVARDHAPERAGPQAMHHVGRQVVQVATIEQQ